MQVPSLGKALERVVVAGYRPMPGCSRELEDLVRTHHPILAKEGLATKRAPMILRGQDGTLIEIYEVTPAYSKESTASNPRVMEVWRMMDDICTYVPAGRLDDLHTLFSEMELLA